MEIKFITEGMACAKCEARVVEKLSSLPGVTAVKACAADGSVVVEGDGLDRRSHRGFGIRRHRVIPRKKKRRMVLPSVFLFCRRSRLVSLQSTIGLFSKLKT